MPNDCFNRVTIQCDIALTQDLEVLIDSLQTDELALNPTNVFNFNSIIQMPPELTHILQKKQQHTSSTLLVQHGLLRHPLLQD